jgi:hypothetical protein
MARAALAFTLGQEDIVRLSSEILSWDFGHDEASGLEFELRYRASEIWRHARERLTGEPSQFDKSDAMGALKRAVNHRLKSLRLAYCFDHLPYPGNKRTLEKFQYYGIIRPALIQELLAIRNAIEHQDAPPPTLESCSRHLDIVWYFLKSTDSLLYLRADNLTFSEPSGESELRFDFSFGDSWRIVVRGNVDQKYLRAVGDQDCLLLDETIDRPEYIKAEVYGLLCPTEEQLTEIARLYFGDSGFWWDDHL